MEKEEFARRMSQLRQAKGVSARDMSLSLGQSAGYINNIENGVNLPSMAMFFYICDYLEVTPEEFFSVELADPMRLKRLNQSLRRLTGHQLELLELLVQEMKKKRRTRPVLRFIISNNPVGRGPCAPPKPGCIRLSPPPRHPPGQYAAHPAASAPRWRERPS